MYKKMPLLQTFQDLSAPVTLDEGHLHWHALKGFVTDYHCTNDHVCSDDSVWENANVWVFEDFPSALTTVTLDEGHRNWYNLKSRATKYFCTKFHDCTGNGIWENVNVFPVFPSAPVTVTLGEGHSNWYGLKGLATRYRCVKFQSRRHTTNIKHTEKPDRARSHWES